MCVCVCRQFFSFIRFIFNSLDPIRFNSLSLSDSKTQQQQQKFHHPKKIVVRKKGERDHHNQRTNQLHTYCLQRDVQQQQKKERKKQVRVLYVSRSIKSLAKRFFFHLKATTQYAYMYHSRTHTKIHHTYITHEKNHSQTVKTNLIEKSRN